MSENPAEPVQKKRNKAPLVFGGLIIAAAVGATTYSVVTRGHESTDDAQVEGHVVNVAARVAGQVTEVLVKDDQLVHAGDPIVKLDSRDYEARLLAAQAEVNSAKAALEAAKAQLALAEANANASEQQARGGLTQARAGLVTSKASIDSARASVTQAESRVTLSRTELDRVKGLRQDGSVSQAELDSKQAAFDQADAALTAARAQLAAAQGGIENWNGVIDTAQGRFAQAQTGPEQVALARAQVGQAEARLAQSEAAQHLAELQLEYTTVHAPITGVISRRTVELGQMVSPERNLLAIVGTEDLWIVANFKEDQIEHMKPGQKASVEIDAYPGHVAHAHVENLAGATGARFSLLPPDNATGNFTKVVQRVPVILRLDDAQGMRLVPGLSADATVHVAE